VRKREYFLNLCRLVLGKECLLAEKQYGRCKEEQASDTDLPKSCVCDLQIVPRAVGVRYKRFV
jgi:hypothetical protein